MAPSRALKSQRISLVGNDEIEAMELSQPGSQSSDDNQVTKMAAKMQREARKRREARRSVIINSYQEAVNKIENAMTLKFEHITKRMVKMHRLRMERLSHLVQKKSAIEAKMWASSEKVESAFIYADKALASAFERRLRSIVEQKKAPIA